MKITDLKENDVIHIRNKKEAKGIAKLLSHLTSATIQKESAKQMVKEAVHFYGNEACINTNNNTHLSYGDIGCYKKTMCNIIPASKFLKPSLKKRVKELEKWRKKLEQPKTAADMEVHFDEVERLPEKWCVKANNETELELIYNSICSQPEAKNLNYYYHFPATDNNICWAHISVQIGYTEISFETFKRLVLKANEKPVELEVGKWYKYPGTSFLMCVRNYDHEDRSASAYGINLNKEWFDAVVDVEGLVPATDEEVKEALIKEAERRGYNKEKVRVDSLGGMLNVTTAPIYWDYCSKYNFLRTHEDCMIFNKGTWAEIISEPEAIDFSKAGQLVCTETGLYILTSGRGVHGTTFSGIVVQDNRNTHSYKIGHHSDEWAKEDFILYEGKLTLSN